MNRSLTLNLGVRYEYYSPPFEANGKSVIPVNGSAGAFGISGTSYAQAFTPGHSAGSLTQLELVGPRSPNPGTQIYKPQYNTILPGAGLSWSIGKDNKTVCGRVTRCRRIATRCAMRTLKLAVIPGMNITISFTIGRAVELHKRGAAVIPGQALATVPLTDRTQTLRVFDTGLRNQYYQNWNISLQREISKDSVLSVRYWAPRARRLLSGINLNSDVINSNGFLNAFNMTRAGGNAPLFDQLFNGLTVPGKGPVNGTTVPAPIMPGSNSTMQSTGKRQRGGVRKLHQQHGSGDERERRALARAGLPQNFFVTNPQFANVYVVGNNANSTYNALQVEYEKRFGHGWVYQGSYTWSKALGESELGSTQTYDNNYRIPQNRSFDKRIMNFNRTNVFKSNVDVRTAIRKGPGDA